MIICTNQILAAMLEQRLVNQEKTSKPDVQDVPQLESDTTTPEREMLDDVGPFTGPETSISVDTLQILDFPLNSMIPGTPDSTKVPDLESPKEFTTNFELCSIKPISPITSQLSTVGEGEVSMNDTMQVNLYIDCPKLHCSSKTNTICRDLLYFERVHPIAPMIHKRRYFAWASEENPSPARACLRSAMRTVAAAMSAQPPAFADTLYASTRRMLETQEVFGETGLPWMTRTTGQQERIEHERIQAWLLLAYYDFLRKPEHHAHLTAGHAFRLLHLSRLVDLDSHDGDAPANYCSPLSSQSSPTIQPVTVLDDAWIETEEKRRTLWTAFILDRLSTMLNDGPLMLHEEAVSGPQPTEF